jgi:GTP-binding protein YchF
MGLSVGIIGLPNVGKSTTFNALTKTQDAQSANYPFCTIEPNKAIVPVDDKRLVQLSKIVNPQRVEYSMIEFVDIAGLVKGASKGEGLGNKFLSNIREVEVIFHLVRCFEDDDITHVENSIDPIRDVQIIETELIFADIEQVDTKIKRLEKSIKTDKTAIKKLEIVKDIKNHLNDLKPITIFDKQDDEYFIELNKELRFLSNKQIIYGANVDEDSLANGNDYTTKLEQYAKSNNGVMIKLCAKIEEELIELEDKEAEEFLKELGVEQSPLSQIIELSFDKLGLMSYFTAGVQEVRAWTINKQTKAPKAASAIHNDFEKGFIKAEVISYDDFIECGGENKAKEKGKMRLEGKEYIVKDGDIMHFKFNV